VAGPYPQISSGKLDAAVIFGEVMRELIYRGILWGLVILTILIVLPHPLATNDGPVHLAFSHLLLTAHQPDYPLQHQVYTIAMKLNPNLAVYLLMATLMRILSPGVVESLVQILCLCGPIAAAYFAISRINPKNAWLSVFVLPISLNQLFFLGLYNDCISTAVFFLAIGTYFWMAKSPSLLRATVLSATLLLAFVCHASGFIMSVAGIGTFAGTAFLLRWRRERQLLPALLDQRYALGAILVPFPLAGLFVSSGTKSATEYGVPVIRRLWQFSKLHELTANYPLRDRFAAAAVSGILLIGFVVVSWRLVRDRSEMLPQRRDMALGAMAGTLVAIVIMMVFPDCMGGGWTHFRRFEIYPYYWMLLVLAFESFTAVFAGIFLATGASAAIFLLGTTVMREGMINQQMVPLHEADRLIGNHCTVLPIVLESRPVGIYKQREWMQYEPFYEAANRLELTGDRVVLFNYLARLDAYPVHFQPSMEPQRLIFHWKPQQSEIWIEKLDIPAFEQSSGLLVDYVLVWGSYKSARRGMAPQVQKALSDFRVIYTSPDGLVNLYKRQNDGQDMCTAFSPSS
jgi:hypothetical protein